MTGRSGRGPAPAAQQRGARDDKRGRCPVAAGGADGWELVRHADVVAVALDPTTFSSRVSRHLKVPNGLDGAEHARFRTLVDRYLGPEQVAALEPRLRVLAADLARSLPRGEPVDAVAAIGARYAVRAQSAWLGWPAALEQTLLSWMEDNGRATRSRQPARTAAVAERFDAIVGTLIASRREAGSEAPDDVTTALLGERIDGRPLRDEELVSILRNWTAGDLGSIAACIGVIVHRLAADADLQQRFRAAGRAAAELEPEIDEILRSDDPFTANRRLATADVEIGGRRIRAGEQVLLNWAAANRDPLAFGDPDAHRPAENADRNLVYGIGTHVCPGRALATLELRLAVEELLAVSAAIELAPGSEPVRESAPYGGFRALPVVLAAG